MSQKVNRIQSLLGQTVQTVQAGCTHLIILFLKKDYFSKCFIDSWNFPKKEGDQKVFSQGEGQNFSKFHEGTNLLGRVFLFITNSYFCILLFLLFYLLQIHEQRRLLQTPLEDCNNVKYYISSNKHLGAY